MNINIIGRVAVGLLIAVWLGITIKVIMVTSDLNPIMEMEEKDIVKEQLIWLSYRLDLLGTKDSVMHQERERQQREILRLMSRLDADGFTKIELMRSQSATIRMANKIRLLQMGIDRIKDDKDSIIQVKLGIQDSLNYLRKEYMQTKLDMMDLPDSAVKKASGRLLIVEMEVSGERYNNITGQFDRVNKARRVDRVVSTFRVKGDKVSRGGNVGYKMRIESVGNNSGRIKQGEFYYGGEPISDKIMIHQSFENTLLSKGKRKVTLYIADHDTASAYIDLR